MRVGYFSHSRISISETFIYDLLKDLSKDKELDLVYYAGLDSTEENIDFELNYVLTGFREKSEKRSLAVFKFGQFFSESKAFKKKMVIQKKIALKALNSSVKVPMNVAYIDYANSAILLNDFLVSKKIPYIVHVHGHDITAALNDPEYVKELDKVLKNAKFLITASNYMKRLLILLGADEQRIKMIRYGIDVASIQPMSWEERVKKTPSVIFVGRFTEKKHPIALLHAFRIVLNAIPNAKLTFIGDGPLKNEMLDRIKTLKMEHAVTFLGSLTREKSFPVINEHWVYAQHSVSARSGDQEGYSLSPAEAAAHELPVVSTLHNGIPEHVIDGETGYLVPEFNFELMAERIIYLLQHPAIAEQMGKKGRKNIEQLNVQSKRVSTIKLLLKEASNGI